MFNNCARALARPRPVAELLLFFIRYVVVTTGAKQVAFTHAHCCRANAHMVYGLKYQHFTLHSITLFVLNTSATRPYVPKNVTLPCIFIHVFLCLLLCPVFFSFVVSCSPIQLYREQYMGKAEIWNFSTSLQLDISQVSAVIFHILQAM